MAYIYDELPEHKAATSISLRVMQIHLVAHDASNHLIIQKHPRFWRQVYSAGKNKRRSRKPHFLRTKPSSVAITPKS